MSKLRWLIAIVAVAMLPTLATAQERGTVTGTVVDGATQRPLAGAQITIAGTQLGTITNQQGRFLIANVPAGAREVRAALIGFGAGTQSVVVPAGGSATVNFTLAQTAVELEGVVVSAVTGQAQRRRELGTNVGNINLADVNQGPITRPADVLTGRVPGVNIQTSGGTTGTAQRIRIRGANSLSLSNEPIIYVDGVRFSNQVFGLGVGGASSNRLNDINPDDIASIEILKGPAATSQYGTEAANGVILITTRRGASGATRWGAYTEFSSVTDPTQYPENWATYQVNAAGRPVFRPNGTVSIQAPVALTAPAAARDTARLTICHNHQAAQGICRQDESTRFNTLMDPRTTPFRDGFRRKYGVNARGGDERVTFYLSGDIEDEQGVIENNVLDKYNLRGNLDAQLTERARVSLNTSFSRNDLLINSDNNSVVSPLINGLVGRPFFDPDSAFFFRNYRAFSPIEVAELNTREAINRFIVGSTANYAVLDWLSLNANAGLDWINRFYEVDLQPGRPLGLAVAAGSWGIGRRDAYRSNQFVYTLNGSAVANWQPLERLGSQTTLGGSFQMDQFQNQFGQGYGTVEGTRDLGSAAGQFTLNEGFDEIRTIGGFISQQFSFDDRLFLTLGMRTDNNSAFGDDFGWVTYPNANLSWVVNEEGWFPQSPFLSTLRVYAGYGVSGLRPQFRQATTLFGTQAVSLAQSDLPAVLLSSTGNPGLSPERTTEYEVGLDAGLLNDRLSANVTYFTKTSRDQLVNVPLPPSFGLTATRLANLAEVRNSGVEVSLDARVFNFNDRQVALNLRLASSTLNNEVLALGQGVNDILVGRGDQRHRVGFPAGAFFQDRYTFQDLNGDGKLDPRQTAPINDREIRIVRDTVNGEVIPNYIGPALPTFTNSLSADLTLFRFITLSTLFEQRGGNYQLDFTSEFRCRTMVGFNDRGCQLTSDPNASLEDQARFIGSGFLGTRYGYIHPADFIKWRELSVNIGVPQQLQNIRALRGASLTLAGRNLATWTDYPGLDPEILEAGVTGFSQNEFNTQPPVRTFTARVNFTF